MSPTSSSTGQGRHANRDKGRLRTSFAVLLLLAGALNVAGYLFRWFYTVMPYDEIVHLVTSFTVSAAIAFFWWVPRDVALGSSRSLAVAAISGAAALLGIGWELFEWSIGIIGDRADTLVDLVMDAFGGVLASLWVLFRA